MRATSRLILAALLLSLAACQTAPAPGVQPLAGAAMPQPMPQLFGTLAPVGSLEWHAAPFYTRNAALRSRAATMLDKKRIAVADAVQIQAHADRVRAMLDALLAANPAIDSMAAIATFNRASAALTAAEAMLKGK